MLAAFFSVLFFSVDVKMAERNSTCSSRADWGCRNPTSSMTKDDRSSMTMSSVLFFFYFVLWHFWQNSVFPFLLFLKPVTTDGVLGETFIVTSVSLLCRLQYSEQVVHQKTLKMSDWPLCCSLFLFSVKIVGFHNFCGSFLAGNVGASRLCSARDFVFRSHVVNEV